MKLKQPLLEKSNVWKTALSSHINRLFRKIRIRKKHAKTSASDSLVNLRNKLTNLNKKTSSKFLKETNNRKIADLEIKIAQILLKEGLEKARKFKKFCNASASFPVHEMWKFKNKLWPKKTTALPVAKRNIKGRLVRTPKELMNTILLEYKDRLRPRCTRSDLKSHIETRPGDLGMPDPIG